MKKPIITTLIIVKIFCSLLLLSCNNINRDFLLNIACKNHFIDTFRLINLKGFGIGNNPVKINGNNYYKFNQAQNDFPIRGFVRNDKGRLLFIDNIKANNEYVFYSPEFRKYKQNAIIKKYSSSAPIEIKFKATFFDNHLNDTVTSISYKFKDAYNSIQPDELVIFYTTANAVSKFNLINCRNDTLEVTFRDTQKIFYKNRNIDLQCL